MIRIATICTSAAIMTAPSATSATSISRPRRVTAQLSRTMLGRASFSIAPRRRAHRRIIEAQRQREAPAAADGQPVAGMRVRGDRDRKAAVGAAQNFAGAKSIAPRRVFDGEALPVDQAEGPVARGRRRMADAIDAAPVQRRPAIVGARDETAGPRRAPAEFRRCARRWRAYRDRRRASRLSPKRSRRRSSPVEALQIAQGGHGRP